MTRCAKSPTPVGPVRVVSCFVLCRVVLGEPLGSLFARGVTIKNRRSLPECYFMFRFTFGKDTARQEALVLFRARKPEKIASFAAQEQKKKKK